MKIAQFLLCFPLLIQASCDGGSGSTSGASGTDTGPPPSTTSSASSADTGGGSGADATTSSTNECEDDYHGNNAPFDMLDLDLDTTETVSIVLGDGVVGTSAEQGGDELVVCGSESDFFTYELACDSYVSVEVRKLEGSEGPPELFLYDSSSYDANPMNPPPIESSEGDFAAFFLRPIQQKLSAGPHAIEVRPVVAGKRAYTLTVTVFPTQDDCS